MLRVVYWFVAGALLGFGVIAILSVGVLTVGIGLILVIIGTIRLGVRGVWAGLVGFGLLPLYFLVRELSDSTLQPAATAQTYQALAIVFGVIALLGVIWGVVATLRGLRAPARVDQ